MWHPVVFCLLHANPRVFPPPFFSSNRLLHIFCFVSLSAPEHCDLLFLFRWDKSFLLFIPCFSICLGSSSVFHTLSFWKFHFQETKADIMVYWDRFTCLTESTVAEKILQKASIYSILEYRQYCLRVSTILALSTKIRPLQVYRRILCSIKYIFLAETWTDQLQTQRKHYTSLLCLCSCFWGHHHHPVVGWCYFYTACCHQYIWKLFLLSSTFLTSLSSSWALATWIFSLE